MKLRESILSANRDDLEVLIGALLQDLLPNIVRSKRLGVRDRMGIDLYQLDQDTGLETIAIQAKSVEREILPSHIKDYRKEIKKYQRLGPEVETYWLVVNKPIRSTEDRRTLESDLAGLVKSGKAKRAQLFDLEPFLAYLETLARDRLVDWSQTFQHALQEDHAQRLRVVPHIASVPFAADTLRSDPTAWILSKSRTYFDRMPKNEAGRFRNPPRFLVTASFGFGKTSTLHAVADQWIKAGGHALFIPATLLPWNAFSQAAGLVDGLLRGIAPADFDFDGVGYRLLRQTLKRDLANSTNWILLIDAIDENPHWASQQHLAVLWAGVAALGIPTIISVRDEVYLTRRMEFSYAHERKRSGEFFNQVDLLDWAPDLISQFLSVYAANQSDPAPPAFTRFQDIVRGGDYEAHYGDIPRRPLFLSMLAEDAWNGAEPERDLGKLYDKYFRNKLMQDWSGPGVGAHAVRTGEVTARHGYEETIERMMTAMQAVAAVMMRANPKLPPGTIGNQDFEDCIRTTIGSYASAEEILLVSVIKPAGRDPETRERLFSFAHQSFLDWFTARNLLLMPVADREVHAPNDAVRLFMRTLETSTPSP